MEKNLFGTDGIRDAVDSQIFRVENLVKLGVVLGEMLKSNSFSSNHSKGEKQCVLIGRDTRASGPYIENALIAGLSSCGVDTQVSGVIPSAGVAVATKCSKLPLGIMISASHNPFTDNGLKFFDGQGHKLSGELEALIEKNFFDYAQKNHNVSFKPGKINRHNSAVHEYLTQVQGQVNKSLNLKGLKLVLDCAHGAASTIAPYLFQKLGANIRLIGSSPDGKNINQGFGSTAPGKLKSEVRNFSADLGIAFDGDADRVLFVDENGQALDGDSILALFALNLKQKEQLNKNAFVATIMSSIALDNSLKPHGIEVLRSPVGDKQVVSFMKDHELVFGGENSGHIIFPNATTGDGILSALKMLEIMQEQNKKLSDLCSFFKPTPKILRSIRVKQKIPFSRLSNTQNAINSANKKLKTMGRVFFRYSGTEMKARIFVEGPHQKECETIADHIEQEFKSETK